MMRLRLRPICATFFKSKFLCGFILLLATILLLSFEESQIGHFSNIYGNFYTQIVFRPIKVGRKDGPTRLNISLLVVVDNAEKLAGYGLAQHTLRCYSALQGYPLLLLDLSREPSIQGECPQTDFMFRRHCALARFLAAHPEVEFGLFLDGDMGVINPNHLLEQYMGPIVDGQADIIFYERTFNGEIMAGSYFLSNTNFSRQFLHFWANYQLRLPSAPAHLDWHFGTDNAAIHAVFLDLFCGQDCADQSRICHKLWNASTDFSSLAPFTACARNVLGSRNVFHPVAHPEIEAAGNVLLLTNFTKFWARDGWLTGNCWSERDFIFHGWQERRQNQMSFAGWNSPFAMPEEQLSSQPSPSCRDRELAGQNWPYKDTFIRAEEEIHLKMEKIVRQRRMDTLEMLGHIL